MDFSKTQDTSESSIIKTETAEQPPTPITESYDTKRLRAIADSFDNYDRLRAIGIFIKALTPNNRCRGKSSGGSSFPL